MEHVRRHHSFECTGTVNHRAVLHGSYQRSSREAIRHLLLQTEVYYDA